MNVTRLVNSYASLSRLDRLVNHDVFSSGNDGLGVSNASTELRNPKGCVNLLKGLCSKEFSGTCG